MTDVLDLTFKLLLLPPEFVFLLSDLTRCPVDLNKEFFQVAVRCLQLEHPVFLQTLRDLPQFYGRSSQRPLKQEGARGEIYRRHDRSRCNNITAHFYTLLSDSDPT